MQFFLAKHLFDPIGRHSLPKDLALQQGIVRTVIERGDFNVRVHDVVYLGECLPAELAVLRAMEDV